MVNISATTANTNATDGALTVAGGVGIGLDLSIGDDIRLISDGSRIGFGANSEIILTHVHDVGLRLTHNADGQIVFQLKSEEDAIIADEVIASLEFAAGDSDGTDGATVAAGIHAIAEGTFSASANATKLVFTTGVSETAAASATAKMTLSSAGLLTIADDFVIKDGGTIGSASFPGALQVSATGNFVTYRDIYAQQSVRLAVDDNAVQFGNDGEIDLIHVHNVGLTLRNSVADTDNTPIVFQLKSEEDAIVADDVIASIEMAAGDSDGTDGATVAAGIHAIAEGTFSASANATKLVFTTGVSETAAASATAKMTLSSAGLLTIADDFMIKDGGTIGVASTNDAITISSAGIVTFKDDIIIKDGGTIGSASDTDAITISSTGRVTFSQEIRTASYIAIDGDNKSIFFGVNDEIRLTHVHDTGLTLSNNIADTDNRPFVLQLKSEEDAIVADDVIASIELAAGDSDGTDGATVAAGIHAIAEDTFSASANATKLVFTTGVSETAASSATAKMTLSSAGLLTIADDFVIKDGGTIGVASDTDAITIASDGVVTMDQIPVFSAGINVSGGSIAGTLSTAAQTNITSLGTLTALTVDDVNINGKVVTITGDTSDTFTITSGAAGATTLATTDAAAAAGHITVAPDGYIMMNPSINGTYFQLSGTSYGLAGTNGSVTQFLLRSMVQDGDLIIQGNDGGSTIDALTFDISDNGKATFLDDVTVGDDLRLATDSSVIYFGTNTEVALTHIHNYGLRLTNALTSANATVLLQLKSEEDIIAADDVIASIEMAAGDSDGTDAATIAAGIHAVAEGAFTASANPTKLVFTTGVSESAALTTASATHKMTLSSAGLLTIADDFMIKDGGTIGVASTNDAITISSAGIVTFKDDIIIKDGGTIGSASATDAITIASSGDVTLTGASGNIVFDKSEDALEFADNVRVRFGTGDDFSIYHSGDASQIAHGGTGDLLIRTDRLQIINASANETMITSVANGAVELYHDNVKKFETTAAGVTLTGELLTTGFSSSDFAAAFIVIEDGGTDGSGGNAGDNLIDETDSDDLLMENVTSWVTSGFTIRDSFGNHLQTVNGVS